MLRTARPVLAAVALSAALLGAGCSAAPPPAAPASETATAAPETAANDPVAWTNAFCATLLPLAQEAKNAPKPEASVAPFVDYLGRLASGFDQAVKGLSGLGPSPVAGGDDVVAKTKASMTSYRDAFAKAKDDLAKADAKDQAALTAALKPVTDLQSAPNPTADLAANPELWAAAQKAPNCQSLNPPAAPPSN